LGTGDDGKTAGCTWLTGHASISGEILVAVILAGT